MSDQRVICQSQGLNFNRRLTQINADKKVIFYAIDAKGDDINSLN